MCFLGMLVGLFSEFVGRQMIRFVVTGSIMSVLRKIVKFSRSIMRALWHGLPPECEILGNHKLLGLARNGNSDYQFSVSFLRGEVLSNRIH
jgi:hypothetical protein